VLRSAIVGLVLAGVGCLGPAPPAAVISTVAEPAGEHCANGGVAIKTGQDTNSNGVLDAEEVTATSYICVPGNSAPQLVRIIAEPPGVHCADGGQAIQLGSDLDADGVFDDSEVTSVSYVCASKGLQMLVRVDSEPAGVNCANGGAAIRSGLDTSGDGTLQESEIQSTSYLCGTAPLPTVINGDFYIHNQTDLAQLSAVTTITGNLFIEFQASSFPSIHLPNLTTIGGGLTTLDCEGASPPCNNFETLSLPNLVSAHDINLHARAMTSVDFSSLVSVQSYIQIYEAQLIEVSLPSYASGGLNLGAMPTVTSVSAPLLATGDVSISDVDVTTLSFPSLQSGGFAAAYLPNLTSISTPLLESARYISVYGNPVIASVSFPMLTEMTDFAQVVIRQNATLQAFSAPIASIVQLLEIKTNPEFPTCAAQALATQWNAVLVTISGNDDLATCP
jgi:hypothetical protein